MFHEPPDSPGWRAEVEVTNRRLWLGSVIAVGAAVVILAIVGSFAGCAGHQPDPRDPVAVAFAAELLWCVDRAPTRAESKACRAKVETKYAAVLDAGAQ